MSGGSDLPAGDTSWKEPFGMWLFGRLARQMGDEEGQGLAEYALILALIAVVAIVALMFLGQSITDLVFTTIGEALDSIL